MTLQGKRWMKMKWDYTPRQKDEMDETIAIGVSKGYYHLPRKSENNCLTIKNAQFLRFHKGFLFKGLCTFKSVYIVQRPYVYKMTLQNPLPAAPHLVCGA